MNYGISFKESGVYTELLHSDGGALISGSVNSRGMFIGENAVFLSIRLNGLV